MPRKALKKSRERNVSPGEQPAAGAVELRNYINLDEVLSAATKLACEMLGGRFAGIALADEEGDITVRSQVGMSDEAVADWHKRWTDAPLDYLARTRRPYMCPDVAADDTYDRDFTPGLRLGAILVVPLQVGEKLVGCLAMCYKEAHQFSAEELQLARLFADHASLSIESTTLLQRERQQRQRAEALVEVLTATASTLSMKEVLIQLCEAVVDISVGERCSIFLLDSERGRLEPVMSLGARDDKLWQKFRSPPAGVRRDPAEQRFLQAATNWEKPIVMEDAENSPILPRWWVKTFALKSIVAYPLRVKDKTIGAMTVHTSGDRVHFPQEEIDTLTAVAKQAAVVIENAHFYEQERQQRQRAEALVEVLSAGASDLSFRKVLATICQAVVNITVGDRCSIFMVDEERRGLKPVMSLGVEDEELWQRFRNPAAGEDTSLLPEIRRLYEAVTEWENPVVIEDAATTSLLSRWWVETFNLKSLVHYPLRVKDRTIGMMTVDAFRERVHFPQEEIDTLAAIAKQAAVFIENARLYEQEQQQRRRAEALVNVLSATASDVSFRKVLAAISQAVIDFSVGERCSIFLFNEETRSLDPVMAMGPGDPILFEKYRASAGLKISDIRGIGEAIRAQKPVIEEHAPGSRAIPSYWIRAFRLKSVAIYPLVHREKTVGILVVNTFSHFTHFPKDEIETLAAVAKQAAIIIEYARLHEQLQEQAITDCITGLFNHRHVHKRLEEEFARASRRKSPFAVMMMDVDKFKEFNDTYGHLQGDEALRFIARNLRETLRAADIVGRYGGDEFLAILPDTTREKAEEVGQRIMSMLAGTPFSPDDPELSVALAMSIGIACYPQDSHAKDELVMFADAALYAAKRLGGNRAVPASGASLRSTPSLKKISA